MSMVNAVGARGQPPVKWGNRVPGYERERGERRMKRLEKARRECKDRNKWRLLSWPYHNRGSSQKKASDIDK